MPSKFFSRANNDTLQAILQNDTYRYVRKGPLSSIKLLFIYISSKGYGLLIGISINLFFFFLFPSILRSIWPYFLSLASSTQLFPQLFKPFSLYKFLLYSPCSHYRNDNHPSFLNIPHRYSRNDDNLLT